MIFKKEVNKNANLHTSQVLGFPSLCDCIYQKGNCVKRVIHTLNTHLSSLCVFAWVFLCEIFWKCWWKTSQEKGYSVEWVRTCFFKVELSENAFPHTSQE